MKECAASKPFWPASPNQRASSPITPPPSVSTLLVATPLHQRPSSPAPAGHRKLRFPFSLAPTACASYNPSAELPHAARHHEHPGIRQQFLRLGPVGRSRLVRRHRRSR